MLLESAASWTAIDFPWSCQRTSSSPLDISQGPKSLPELWTFSEMTTSYHFERLLSVSTPCVPAKGPSGCFINLPGTLTSDAGAPAIPHGCPRG